MCFVIISASCKKPEWRRQSPWQGKGVTQHGRCVLHKKSVDPMVWLTCSATRYTSARDCTTVISTKALRLHQPSSAQMQHSRYITNQTLLEDCARVDCRRHSRTTSHKRKAQCLGKPAIVTVAREGKFQTQHVLARERHRNIAGSETHAREMGQGNAVSHLCTAISKGHSSS